MASAPQSDGLVDAGPSECDVRADLEPSEEVRDSPSATQRGRSDSTSSSHLSSMSRTHDDVSSVFTSTPLLGGYDIAGKGRTMDDFDVTSIFAEGFYLGIWHCRRPAKVFFEAPDGSSHFRSVFSRLCFVDVLELDVVCGFCFHIWQGPWQWKDAVFFVECFDCFCGKPEIGCVSTCFHLGGHLEHFLTVAANFRRCNGLKDCSGRLVVVFFTAFWV